MAAISPSVVNILSGAVSIDGICWAALPVLEAILSQTSLRAAMRLNVFLPLAEHKIMLDGDDSLTMKLEAAGIGVELSDE